MIAERIPLEGFYLIPENDTDRSILETNKLRIDSRDICYANTFLASLYFKIGNTDPARYENFIAGFDEEELQKMRRILEIAQYLYFSGQEVICEYIGLPYPPRAKMTKQNKEMLNLIQKDRDMTINSFRKYADSEHTLY